MTEFIMIKNCEIMEISKTYTVLASRFFYAMNWYTISPLLIYIAAEFHTSVNMAGEMIFYFLLGAGIFQIPTGLISYKIGPKLTSVFGMYIIGISTILSSFSTSVEYILLSRFFVGVGAAMFFSPGLAIIKYYADEKSMKKLVGLYNSFFNFGAGFSVIFFSYYSQIYGWRSSLFLSGILALLIGIIDHVTLDNFGFKNKIDLKPILNRNVIILGIALGGFWGAQFTTAQILTYFLETSKNYNFVLSGLSSTVILIAGIFGGFINPYLSNSKNLNRNIIILTVLVSLFIVIIPYLPLYIIYPDAFLIGFISAADFSLAYYIISNRSDISVNSLSLALGTLNSLQILIGAPSSLLFSFIFKFSINMAFVFLGFYCAIFLLIFLVEIRKC
ncbi:MAG: MFS transporter [Thermoplasmata archaeon]